GTSFAAAIGRHHRRLGRRVVCQDHLLVGVKRLVNHLAQGGAQARRPTVAGYDKRARKGSGVLEDADLVVDVDLVILGLGFAEELVGRIVGANGGSTKQRELADGRRSPYEHRCRAHWSRELEVGKRQLPFTWLAAALKNDPGAFDPLVAYERLHAAQAPGPLHRVAAGSQLGGANDPIGR